MPAVFANGANSQPIASPDFGGAKPAARSHRLEPIRVGEFLVPADEFPVLANQIRCSVPSRETVHSALELQRKWTPEPSGKRRNGRKFQKFPVIFPVLRESGVRRAADPAGYRYKTYFIL